jgi:hypothetical protein
MQNLTDDCPELPQWDLLRMAGAQQGQTTPINRPLTGQEFGVILIEIAFKAINPLRMAVQISVLCG